MKIFVVNSEKFSRELASYYLEKEVGLEVYHFFSISEITLYVKMRPDIILFDENGANISREQISAITHEGTHKVDFLGLCDHSINHYRSSREFHLQKLESKLMNSTYYSISTFCKSLIAGGSKNIAV